MRGGGGVRHTGLSSFDGLRGRLIRTIRGLIFFFFFYIYPPNKLRAHISPVRLFCIFYFIFLYVHGPQITASAYIRTREQLKNGVSVRDTESSVLHGRPDVTPCPPKPSRRHQYKYIIFFSAFFVADIKNASAVGGKQTRASTTTTKTTTMEFNRTVSRPLPQYGYAPPPPPPGNYIRTVKLCVSRTHGIATYSYRRIENETQTNQYNLRLIN